MGLSDEDHSKGGIACRESRKARSEWLSLQIRDKITEEEASKITGYYPESIGSADKKPTRKPKPKPKKVEKPKEPKSKRKYPPGFIGSPEHKAMLRENMRKAREIKLKNIAAKKALPGGLQPGIKPETLWKTIQDYNILQFATLMGYSFDGRPGQELTLRLTHGLGLPDGTLKTFVRVPGDGFTLEEKEMTWMEYYTLLTGNAEPFELDREPTEVYVCVGARGGKSTLTSLEGCYQITRDEWLKYLLKGQKAFACVIATNLLQARGIIQDNCSHMLQDSPLEKFIDKEGQLMIKLKNGLAVRSYPCNPRAPRGFPYFLTIYDESAWYFAEGAKADEEIHAAVNPRRAQFPGSKHIEITTPAAKQGRFYNVFSQGGRIHNRLTIKAPTWTFRPELYRINPDLFHTSYQENPDIFNREFGAEFDETVSQFLPEEEILAALNLPGDLPAQPGMQYMAGVDASGLSGNDRFGFALCGRDSFRARYVVPIVRSWPDTEPEPIMRDLKVLCRAFRVHMCFTDRYAKGWVHAALRNIGLEPVVCPPAEVVWNNAKRIVTGRIVDLPNTPNLKSGLLKTQGSYTASNRLSIVHPRDKFGHGDEGEAVVRSLYGASNESYWRSYTTPQEDDAYRVARKAEEEYDPLTYGRV